MTYGIVASFLFKRAENSKKENFLNCGHKKEVVSKEFISIIPYVFLSTSQIEHELHFIFLLFLIKYRAHNIIFLWTKKIL